jgi:anthranilate synthase component 2
MSEKVHVLLIDNFDSFTFNLVDELTRRGAQVEVWRNDISAAQALALAEALPEPRLIVLSPGPGTPAEAGCCIELVRCAAGRVPIFGVCLGHQAIVAACGGLVSQAGAIVHGKASRIEHDGSGIFAGLPSPMTAARYHSLAAAVVPAELRVTAWTGSVVMAVEHVRHTIAGVQFHPESVLTPHGGRLIDNLLVWAAGQTGHRGQGTKVRKTGRRAQGRGHRETALAEVGHA